MKPHQAKPKFRVGQIVSSNWDPTMNPPTAEIVSVLGYYPPRGYYYYLKSIKSGIEGACFLEEEIFHTELVSKNIWER